LYKWNVSNVISMANMFRDCRNFNRDITGWDVSKVTDMGHMFYNCYYFNQDLTGWNTSNLEDRVHMFEGCKRLEKREKWCDESNKKIIDAMTFWCKRFWVC